MMKPYPRDITKDAAQALRDWADAIESQGLLDAEGSGDNEVITKVDGSLRPGPRFRRVFVFTRRGIEPVGEGEETNWNKISPFRM